jgi:hypothetical protein
MGERIRRLTARELERLLKDYGFQLVSGERQPSQVAPPDQSNTR